MATSKRTKLKGSAAGLKAIKDLPIPADRHKGTTDVNPPPLHGYGITTQHAWETTLGVSYDDFYGMYIASIGGKPKRMASFCEGDTPEEQCHLIVARMMMFLAEYKTTKDIVGSYSQRGLNRGLVYNWKQRHQFFEEMWEQISEEKIDVAEKALYQRAVDGVSQPVYSNGQHVGDITKYSDDLLKFMLSGHRAQIYRQAEIKVRQQIEHEMHISGTLGLVAVDLRNLTDDELEQLELLMDKVKVNNG